MKPGRGDDRGGLRREAPDLEPHPVRDALVDLIHREGVITATDAARELGGSTGLYSFHLRRLARHGVIEEAPGARGRVRPWRLVQERIAMHDAEPSARAPGAAAEAPEPGLGEVARGLEDESYRRWLDYREAAPRRWRRDEAFSQVVYVTPEEMAGMAEVIRALIGQYRYREDRPAQRPAGAAPVAVVARLFPLLEPGAGNLGRTVHGFPVRARSGAAVTSCTRARLVSAYSTSPCSAPSIASDPW